MNSYAAATTFSGSNSVRARAAGQAMREYQDLGDARQPSGKVVTAWAVEGDLDPAHVVPGLFEMEWPRGSGRVHSFPEVDRVAWFALAEAKERLPVGQRDLLERLAAVLNR